MRLEDAKKYVEQVGDLASRTGREYDTVKMIEEDMEQVRQYMTWFSWRADQWTGLMSKYEAWREECLQRIEIMNEEIDIHIQVIRDIPDEISREVLSLYADAIRKDPYRRNMRAIVQYEERGLSERNVLRHLKEKAYPFIAAAVPVYHASIAEVIEAHKAGQGACQKYAVM